MSNGHSIALHAMAVFSKYLLLNPARLKNPQEVWKAFCSSLLGVFGQPKSTQMDDGGEWETGVWADICSGRRVRLQFQGMIRVSVLSVEMVLHVAVITVGRRAATLRRSRFPLRPNGV